MDPIGFVVICIALWGILQRNPGLPGQAAAEYQAGRRGGTTPAAEAQRQSLENAGLAPSSAGGALRRFLGNAWRNHWNGQDRKQQERQQRRGEGEPGAGKQSWLRRRANEAAARYARRYRGNPQPDPTSNPGSRPGGKPAAPEPGRPEPFTPSGPSGPEPLAGGTPGQPDPAQPTPPFNPPEEPRPGPHGEDPGPGTFSGDSDPLAAESPEPAREPIRVNATLGEEVFPQADPAPGPVRLTPAIDPPHPGADHARGDRPLTAAPPSVPESEQPPMDDWNPSDAIDPAEAEALRHELFGNCSGNPDRCPHCAAEGRERDRQNREGQTSPAPSTSDGRAPIRVPATVSAAEPAGSGTATAVLELEGTPDMSNALATRGIPVTGVVSGAAETQSIYRETAAAIHEFQQRLTVLSSRMASLGDQTLGIVQFAGGSSVVVRMTQAAEALASLRASAGACGSEVLPLLTRTRSEFTRRNS